MANLMTRFLHLQYVIITNDFILDTIPHVVLHRRGYVFRDLSKKLANISRQVYSVQKSYKSPPFSPLLFFNKNHLQF